MITKLESFYLLNNKLIYVSDQFTAHDPLISPGFNYNSSSDPNSTSNTTVTEFKLDNISFKAELSSHISSGPIRGSYHYIIYRNNDQLINYEKGSRGHGFGFYKGEKIKIEGNDVFLLGKGRDFYDAKKKKYYMDLDPEMHYLLWFKNVLFPNKYTTEASYAGLVDKESYIRPEIEHLRQKEWDLHTTIDNHEVHIVKTSIPGFHNACGGNFQNWKVVKIAKSNIHSAYDKTEILIGNEKFEKKYWFL